MLSPILFGLYIDELLSRLKQSGYGCMVGHLFCGALGYADDVSILAPSLYALRRMCDICSDYGLEYNLQFNPAKCKLLNFSQQRDVFFSFSYEYVPVVDCCKHLGHFVGPGARNTLYRDAAHNLVRRVNDVLSNFSHCNIDVLYKLFTSYCTSYYSSCLWSLEDSKIE